MEKKNILIFLGSLREYSYNKSLANQLKALDIFNIAFADIASLPFLNEDLEENLPETIAHFRKVFSESDGVIIISPEYNWAAPAVIKNSIDWLSTNKINLVKEKPFAVIGASSGTVGTARMQMEIKLILFHLGAKLLNFDVLVPKAPNIIKDGEIKDEALITRLQDFAKTFNQFI